MWGHGLIAQLVNITTITKSLRLMVGITYNYSERWGYMFTNKHNGNGGLTLQFSFVGDEHIGDCNHPVGKSL